MKQFIVVLLALLLVSCGKEEQHDFTLNGHVKGLKKGTVYLQKQQDTIMVTLDSVAVNGDSHFVLHSKLQEPEILFLKLDKNDNEEGTIAFFADKGITEINSSLKNFNIDATVKGSKQQAILDKYLDMMSKFNDKNLDLIKESLESQKAKDTSKVESLKTDFDNLLKSKYRYTINFAVSHPDSEVSPYLAISEVPNTSISYLQQIYDTLTTNVKASKYGKQLDAFIKERKLEKEKQDTSSQD
ncbi:DUF4369 domain-containing protein [Psychroserpens luteolus]|uniref:DUF4369 domain-containing protein n=1 Tax=Psychroserpens luteolus TaxID=2855840 RepID=UPI001E5B9FB7|nr:DUF4369 domain-containing protein [Psychroserpens luteolus]MCD2261023.1 DUF4369 domain-containing protein [Psychroserpens luteolus]